MPIDAQATNEGIKCAGESIEFSKELAEDFPNFKPQVGCYYRPNTKGDKLLMCIMLKKDVENTIEENKENPDWEKPNKLNMDTSRSVPKKNGAIMLGTKIKLLVTDGAANLLKKGDLKKDHLTVKALKDCFLFCYQSELDKCKSEADCAKIPRTGAAKTKVFTIAEEAEEIMKELEDENDN